MNFGQKRERKRERDNIKSLLSKERMLQYFGMMLQHFEEQSYYNEATCTYITHDSCLQTSKKNEEDVLNNTICW